MSFRVNGAIVSSFSLLLSFAILAFGCRTWFGDSHDFFNYAYALWHHTYDPHMYYRTVGYPLMMWALLVPAGYFTPLFVAQVLAAGAIPVMVYFILAPTSVWVAMWSAIALAASLIPFQYSLTIYPDAACMSAMVLLVALLAAWLRNRDSIALVYLLGGAVLWLMWLRPASVLLAAPVIIALLWHRASRQHAMIAIVLIFGANAALQHWQAKYGPQNSMMGRQMFFNEFIDGADQSVRSTIDLKTALVKAGADAQKIDAAFARPSEGGYWTLFMAGETLGREGDRLFATAAIDQALAHPAKSIARFVSRYWDLVMGPPWRFTGDGIVEEHYPFVPASPDQSDRITHTWVPVNEAPFLAPPSAPMKVAAIVFSTVCPIFIPATFVLMVIGVLLALWRRSNDMALALAVFAMHAINTAALAALVDPRLRYHMQGIPVALIGAGIGVHQLLSLRQFVPKLRYAETAL